MKKLADRIYQFIDKYTGVTPDWDEQYDDGDDKFTSPILILLPTTVCVYM